MWNALKESKREGVTVAVGKGVLKTCCKFLGETQLDPGLV